MHDKPHVSSITVLNKTHTRPFLCLRYRWVGVSSISNHIFVRLYLCMAYSRGMYFVHFVHFDFYLLIKYWTNDFYMIDCQWMSWHSQRDADFRSNSVYTKHLPVTLLLKCRLKRKFSGHVIFYAEAACTRRAAPPARLLLSVLSRICSNADMVVDECERQTDSTWRRDVTKLPFDRDEAASGPDTSRGISARLQQQ